MCGDGLTFLCGRNNGCIVDLNLLSRQYHEHIVDLTLLSRQYHGRIDCLKFLTGQIFRAEAQVADTVAARQGALTGEDWRHGQ